MAGFLLVIIFEADSGNAHGLLCKLPHRNPRQPKSPDPRSKKETNGQTSDNRQIHGNWTAFLDFRHCAQWLWFLAGCHIRS